MYCATSFCERENSSKRSVMKSESDFVGAFDLAAERLPFDEARLTVAAAFAPCFPFRVRALVAAPPLERVAVFAIGAVSFCGRRGFPSRERSNVANVLDRRRDPRGSARPDEPQHGRLRPRARRRRRCSRRARPRSSCSATTTRRRTRSTGCSAAARCGSPSPPRTSSRRGAASRGTGGRWRGCAAPRSRPTRCSRGPPRSRAPPRGSASCSPASRTSRWRSGSRASRGASRPRERPAALAEADLLREPCAVELLAGDLRLCLRVRLGVLVLGRREPLLEDLEPRLARVEIVLEGVLGLGRRVEVAQVLDLVLGDLDQAARQLGRLGGALRRVLLELEVLLAPALADRVALVDELRLAQLLLVAERAAAAERGGAEDERTTSRRLRPSAGGVDLARAQATGGGGCVPAADSHPKRAFRPGPRACKYPPFGRWSGEIRVAILPAWGFVLAPSGRKAARHAVGDCGLPPTPACSCPPQQSPTLEPHGQGQGRSNVACSTPPRQRARSRRSRPSRPSAARTPRPSCAPDAARRRTRRRPR